MDALRDQVRDKVRAFAHSIKGIVKNKSSGGGREISDRLTFLLSMENGFIWNDTYASGQLDLVSKNKVFCEVLNKVNGLINTHPDDNKGVGAHRMGSNSHARSAAAVRLLC